MVSATSVELCSGSDDFAHLAVSAYQRATPANHQINRAHGAVVEQVTAIMDVVPLMSVRRLEAMISSISGLGTQTTVRWANLIPH